MNKLHLIHSVDQILSTSRYPVPRKKLEDQLECSRSTVNRLIQYMRDSLGAPIEYDHKLNGYRYVQEEQGNYQLPGLWFNAKELHALLTTYQLLNDIQPGLLESHIKPLQIRIENILAMQKYQSKDIKNRVKVLQKAVRPLDNYLFQQISSALLDQQRITIEYHGRGNNEITTRDISPQRMVYYNNNWYLDAWCYTRKNLRTFSIDRIKTLKNQNKPTKAIDNKTLDEHLSTSYGIFAGKPQHTAKLLFSAEQARWVADEQWHPEQQGETLQDGRYQLSVPYNNPQELIMDILKYGPEVEVIAPAELKKQVKEKLSRALEKYK